MDKTISSDLNPTMLASKTFDHIIEHVQTSNLNFQLQLSPFSATISLKKSFVKDRFGNILLPSSEVNENELKIKMQEYSDLLGENDQLKTTIMEMQEHNKSKDNTIEILEEKLSKAEASALKAFADKNDEVTSYKTALKNANKEIYSLKNELSSKHKNVKEAEKELYNQNRECDKVQDNLKKCKLENDALRSENKKLLKKLRQKGKRESLENNNDVNENNPDVISSKEQENHARVTPALSQISPSTLTRQPSSPVSSAASPSCSAPLSPQTPPPATETNLGRVFETLGTASTGSSGLASQEMPPLSSSTDTHLKTSESSSKHFFNFDAQFDKIFELVEAYEKKKKDSQI